MATYLSGVTDFIPDYQPFQPDYNFYANFLQYKQNQYDTNWKSLSNLYGQYFNAELTNPENIKIKDKMLKQIDFDLNRIASLDLSLEQNVNQAAQVFTPFYEDKPLMRDMVYTKNYNNEFTRAQGLLNSKDEKESKQYWSEGLEYMMYKREEFKNAKREELVNIPDTKYIPNVNALDYYYKTAKDLDISMDITQSDGRYFVRKKNGDQLLQPLENVFAAAFASNPSLQQKYQVEAYVNRKRHIQQNKDKYQGSELETERNYLTTQLATINEYAKLKNASDKANTKDLQTKLDNVTQKLDTGQGNQFSEDYQKQVMEALGIAKTNESMSDQLVSTVDNSNIETASEDLEKLRYQVDAGVASMLANKEIQMAAYNYSRKNMVVDIAADPYGVSAQNNAYRLQQQQHAHELKMLQLDKKHKDDVELATIKAGLDNGSLLTDEKGNIIPNMAAFTPLLTKGRNVSATDAETSLIKENHLGFIEQTRESADPMVREMVRYMKNLVKSGVPKEEVNKMFFGKKDGSLWSNMDEFWNKYEKNAGGYLYGLSTQKDNKLSKLYARVMKYATANRGDDDISANFLQSQNHGKFNEYLVLATSMHTVNEKNHETILKNIKSSTEFGSFPSEIKDKLSKLLITSSNGLISEEEFIKAAKPIVDKIKPGLPKNIGQGPFEQAYYSMSKEQKTQLDKLLDSENKKKGKKDIGVIPYSKRLNNLSEQDVKRISRQYFSKIYNVDPNTGTAINNEKVLKNMYKDAKRSYVEAVQNSKEILSIVPGIGGKANASYSPAEQTWMIYPSIIGTEGFRGWKELVTRDLGNVNWYDESKNNISFYGNSINAVDKTKKLYDDPKDLVNISNYIVSKLWTLTGDKKALPFKMASNVRAMEKRNKGSMTIYPDYKFLKELLTGDGKGMLDEALIKTIATNGITYITDSKNFNNSVFRSNQYTPLEAAVRALGQVSYTHPMGGGSYTISQDNTGVSPYTINYSLNELQPDGTTYTNKHVFPPGTYNLEALVKEISDGFTNLSDYNTAVSRARRAGSFNNQ
jgi:hypothetical protein